MNSQISSYYRLSLEERRARLCEATGLNFDELSMLWDEAGLPMETAEGMIENVVALFSLPLGICTNLQVNGRDRLVPMVVEESSVVAAASNAAKMLRAGGGIKAESTPPLMIGQVQLLGVAEPEVAEQRILERREDLLAQLNEKFPAWEKRGGGPREIEVRHLPPVEADDPLGHMLVVHLVVDVCDAMGANAINSMCEYLAPTLAEISGGYVRLRILSNLSDRRLVTVSGRIPVQSFCRKGQPESYGVEVAKGIEESSVLAERDPYRAATHNKGVMNGVDSVLIATGQDYRAVEAGAHAYAARNGRYSSMSKWRYRDGYLYGEMTLPLAVGTVGGIVKLHPSVKAALYLLQVESAQELAEIAAAVGLAQNVAALRALSAEGIQKGHMRLHAGNIAAEVGATQEELPRLVAALEQQQFISQSVAKELLEQIRSESA